MNTFSTNVLLALIWSALHGEFTLTSLVIGFLLGYLILSFGAKVVGAREYVRRLPMVVGFIIFFIKELVIANLQVMYDILTPTHYSRPSVLAIPLDAKTPLEITFLANLITLTPGTLSLDCSDDCKVLYIHAMFVDDVEAFKKQIKDGLEKRLLEVLR